MSKTFIYSLGIILLFVLIIRPLNTSKSTTHESESGATHGGGGGSFNTTNEDGIATGASGQMKYRIGGYTN